MLRWLFWRTEIECSPPTYREIADAFGFTHPAAKKHVARLAEKGYVVRPDVEYRPRSLRCTEKAWRLFGIQVQGHVPAGSPEVPYEDHLDTLTPWDLYPGPEGHFALQVRGDSLTRAGILPDDILILAETSTARDGDIVVAYTDDGTGEVATVKRLRGGQLVPESDNPDHSAIPMANAQIIGRVIRVVRSLK